MLTSFITEVKVAIEDFFEATSIFGNETAISLARNSKDISKCYYTIIEINQNK